MAEPDMSEPDLPCEGEFWPDNDEDGHGDPEGESVCPAQDGYVANADDCDDTNAEISPSAEDLPDPDFRDTNCDGIDGDAASMAFVNVAAEAEEADGTRELPFPTLGAGLALAANNPDITGVAVSVGLYTESLNVVNGVSVYGGYDAAADWARAAENEVVIYSENREFDRVFGARCLGVTQPTMLDALTIRTGSNEEAEGSVYAFYIARCPGLHLRGVTVEAGRGGDGIAGAPGRNGMDGRNGTGGGNCGGAPGAGGTSSCGAFGGVGGAGSPVRTPGHNGSPEGCGGRGGPRGGGGAGGDGGNGCSPEAAGPGVDGFAGEVGGVGGGLFWEIASGGNGEMGPNGMPGGGGGGGGGAAVIGGTGGAGGGGGAGGCGGHPGTGGTGGGGSFGMFIVNSTGLVLEDCIVRTGSGGAGGAGGAAGNGGAGGRGAGGGNGREAFACGGLAGPGAGGDGGHGANGGRGGHGGGGAGGPSIPVLCVGSSVDLGKATTEPGAGGAPGASEGFPGPPGVSAGSFGCEPEED